MPYFHCDKCHHEFESYGGKTAKAPKCDWCGSDSHMIEEKTPLERMTDEIDKMGADKFLERLGMIEKKMGREIL